ncbi:fumarylacetoacetate hydrolase family protein [Alsobacter sp. KACC 23698]|uniref:Fumarylacetoacetate hydrolase family protein n=1 Tax=Alsobacter sp. KACC 23698 TaxID=3149229 RepID=A0AAU7JLM8_9HYPH
MEYVIPAPPVTSLRVVGSDAQFPVRRIYCIGRNYAEHAIEMGHDPNKEPPFFFQKNPDNILPEGKPFPYPAKSEDVHFEVELVVALKTGGSNIPVERAMDCVYGYGIGLDMTRRDLQGEAKKLGRPWEIGKAFEHSAPCGPLTPADKVGRIEDGSITLEVNGQLRQKGDINQMIWKIPEMISYLSDYFVLAPGDLIMSGTPSGVGAVKKGDRLVARVDRVGEFAVTVE